VSYLGKVIAGAPVQMTFSQFPVIPLRFPVLHEGLSAPALQPCRLYVLLHPCREALLELSSKSLFNSLFCSAGNSGSQDRFPEHEQPPSLSQVIS